MRILYLILLIIFFGCKNDQTQNDNKLVEEKNSFNDNTTPGSKDPITKITSIKDIQQEYQKINSEYIKKSLDSTSFKYNCYNERSGVVSYFSDRNGIRLIEHSYNEYSHYSSIHRYYIKNDKPFFIYYTDTSWQFEGESNGQPGTKDDITEKRYYLIKDQLIQCLAKMYRSLSYSENNPIPEDVPNKEVPCPSINKLHQSFKTLLSYSDETSEIKCLEGYQ